MNEFEETIKIIRAIMPESPHCAEMWWWGLDGRTRVSIAAVVIASLNGERFGFFDALITDIAGNTMIHKQYAWGFDMLESIAEHIPEFASVLARPIHAE